MRLGRAGRALKFLFDMYCPVDLTGLYFSVLFNVYFGLSRPAAILVFYLKERLSFDA